MRRCLAASVVALSLVGLSAGARAQNSDNDSDQLMKGLEESEPKLTQKDIGSWHLISKKDMLGQSVRMAAVNGIGEAIFDCEAGISALNIYLSYSKMDLGLGEGFKATYRIDNGPPQEMELVSIGDQGNGIKGVIGAVGERADHALEVVSKHGNEPGRVVFKVVGQKQTLPDLEFPISRSAEAIESFRAECRAMR